MIRIVNLRSYCKQGDEILIKVDRSSVLGNPFYMHNESERNEVCDDYHNYFYHKLTHEPKFSDEVNRIRIVAKDHDVALGCWCYPKRCHSETIKEFIEFAIRKEKEDEKRWFNWLDDYISERRNYYE